MSHPSRPARHRLWLQVTLVISIGAAVGAIATAGWAKLETWREEGPGAFAKAHREGLVVTDNGRVRLGHTLASLGSLAAERVWDLARDGEGAVYAATGDSGKVFRREPKADAPWTVVFDSADSQVLCLVVCPDGTIFAGTGPNGQVVNLSDPKHPTARPDAKVRYIWDLAADSHGNLFAATGPDGQLWKRSADGKWSLLHKSKASHLLCLAIGPDDSIYAGGDAEGLITRVSPDGKATILFDAPQAEVRTLLWAGDGALYAGTAVDAGGATSTRSSMFVTRAGGTEQFQEGAGADRPPGILLPTSEQAGAVAAYQAPTERAAQTKGAGSRPPQGGSAAPRPITPGDNAVYRLDADGAPREVLRFKALVHALAWADDRLLVGTGPDGLLYEVREHGHDTVPLAKLDHGQILALLCQPDGTVAIGAGDPGAVVQLAPSYAATGSLTSEVHDTKLVSRFGALSWRCDQPPGTSIAFQSRTGNVGEPDDTWSSWSAEQTEPEKAFTASPPGRFVQYRARLRTSDPRRTPELRSVSLSYRTANLAPEITRLDVPDLSSLDGAARQTRLNLRWDASDPNDDDVNFSLLVRKAGWPDWIKLTELPITEKTYAWDTTAFPSGHYKLKLLASDRPSNSPSEALSRDRESATFIVDHDAPIVKVVPRAKGAAVTLTDELTRLVKADYALDGGPWIAVFPDDGLFDTLRETITIALADLKSGTHVLMVRATDSAGNVGAGDALVDGGK
jgi:hypothetical protein